MIVKNGAEIEKNDTIFCIFYIFLNNSVFDYFTKKKQQFITSEIIITIFSIIHTIFFF